MTLSDDKFTQMAIGFEWYVGLVEFTDSREPTLDAYGAELEGMGTRY